MKYNKRSSFGREKLGNTEINVPTFNEVMLSNEPSSDFSAISKGYLDRVLEDQKYYTGDIRISSTIKTPTGFLRCNGAYLNKNIYSELYEKIGNTFTHNILKGNGKPHLNQYYVNEKMKRELYFWNVGTTLPGNSIYFSTIVTKNRVYLIGRNSGNRSEIVTYTAQITINGLIGPWVLGPSFPIRMSHCEVIVVKNKVYIIGGFSNNPNNSIYRGIIDEDGFINNWEYYGTLPFTVYKFSSIITSSRLYILGGIINGVTSNKTFWCNLDVNGDLSSWYEGNNLPENLDSHNATIVRNRVYILAGNLLNGSTSNRVYYGSITNDGFIENWIEAESLPIPLKDYAIYTSKTRIYILGGRNNNIISNTIFSAVIEPDGSLGTWEIFGLLPSESYGGNVVITSNNLYYIGGSDRDKFTNKTYYVISTGGINDYTLFNNGIYNSENPIEFRLPDYSFLENRNLYFFIKS